MKKGYLSQYFEGVAFKMLSGVEVNSLISNQHEFNGVGELKKILGEPKGKRKYQAKFLYLTDDIDNSIFNDGFLTWYDAREKARLERGINRSEYRLYFSENAVLNLAKPSDILVIAKRNDNTLLAIICKAETTISKQILLLFNFSDLLHPKFSVRDELETEQDQIKFASRFILESIGISVEVSEDIYLEKMLKIFSGKFPTTREFSAFARSTVSDINVQDGQDEIFMAWMEREEILFRTLEKHIISNRLSEGFNDDVDGFISFSLSVQNRRKSRVGFALENHLEMIFKECGIRYSRTPVTENNSKPDFIFPGINEYQDQKFDFSRLTMLGVKSSCKDRWRQVLAEADRIKNKHLFTLETAISKNQTDEMQSKNLQLVLPKILHKTYSEDQQKWLIDIKTFTDLVLKRQMNN
ncbi:EcoRII C terminal [Allochromatium warmingii]|uniref:EcoRII C terminal n=1 Tax=Allochromatium warmingii TaxID=61595 RepID=A0A1H3EXC3_ALLWA|nr:type II restriction endonuclease [Allochromatium warmingii]SDX83426.1 EcoRII C terminal [Allochromatium warmingii]